MVDYMGYIVGMGKLAGYAGILIFAMVFFGIVSYFLWTILAYNIRVVIREITDSGNLVSIDWARIKVDKKSGAEYWKLKKRKHIIPRPPAKAISTTNKGKQWVELFYIGNGQYVPAAAYDKTLIGEDKFVKAFQPISDTQRSSYVDQLEKSEGYKKKGLHELLTQALPYIVLIFMLTIFMLFFGEAMTPTLEAAGTAAAVGKDFRETAEILREVMGACNGVQTLGGAQGNFTPPD